jgi:Undecaprenyl-phosphate glucose phosphotransferase
LHTGNLEGGVNLAGDAIVTAAPAGAMRTPARPRARLGEAALAAAAHLSRQPISPLLVTGLVRLLEFAVLLAAGAAIYLAYVAPESGLDLWYSAPVFGGPLLAVLLIQIADGYTIPTLRSGVMQLGRVFIAWTLVFALFTMAAFLAKIGDTYSRVWVGTWYLSGLVLFTGLRLAESRVLRRWAAAGRLERRAVIVGGGAAAEELVRALEAQPGNDIHICGIFDDRKDDRSPAVVAGCPKLGTVAELVEFGRIARVDLLIVSLPITAENRLLQLLKCLWVLPVDIRLSAHTNKLRFRPRSYSFIGTVPFLDVFDKPITDWDYLVKRAFDLVIASLALVVLSPLMAAVALAIRLESPGPVLFRQKRYGFNNNVIEVCKYRSMYHRFADPEAKNVVTRNDPRVTAVGRFIRRTSLDELPQLFNVIRGDLSLVGPRPHAVNAHHADRMFEEVVDGYFARHRVKPGVTGWAQINGLRGEIDSPDKIRRRVEHDLYYIENWSVLFDLHVLLVTPFRLLNTENAY